MTLKSATSPGGSGPPPNSCFLGPQCVHIRNDTSIDSAVFVWPKVVLNRKKQTQRPRNTCSSRPLLMPRITMHPITKQPQQEQEREQCHEAWYEPLTPDATQLKSRR